MNSAQMIKELTLAFGAPGFEDDVLDVAKKYIPTGYKYHTDSLLNFYIQKENKPNIPTVLLDAHSDEIGLMVQAVTSNGLIVFTNLGGWVPAALYAQKMSIKNQDGEIITGVVVAKMPHFGGGNDTVPTIESMRLDIGASSKDEVINDYKIAPGCPIVPHGEFEQRGDTMICKAFDDRIGCAAVLDVLDKIKDLSLDVNVVGALSSQEEVGLRGAKAVANHKWQSIPNDNNSPTIRPDVAICFEGAPADDTLVEPFLIQSVMGKGPMLRHMDATMITNPKFLRFAFEIAEKHNIPVQEAVRTRGGTNASAYYATGIPTIVVASPVRYAHSHHSMTSMGDYEKTVVLTIEILKALHSGVILPFYKKD